MQLANGYVKTGYGTRPDLTGSRYGLLVVRELLPIRVGANRVWGCTCDCGEEVKVTTMALAHGRSSCGCVTRKRCGEIPGKYWSNLASSASRRGIEFLVTIQEAWSLFERQGRRCALSGAAIGFGRQKTASLDRIDSEGVYEVGNVQWVHKSVNYMKMDLPNEEFIAWCKMIARTQVAHRRGSGSPKAGYEDRHLGDLLHSDVSERQMHLFCKQE